MSTIGCYEITENISKYYTLSIEKAIHFSLYSDDATIGASVFLFSISFLLFLFI